MLNYGTADLYLKNRDYFSDKIISFFLLGLLINGLGFPIDKILIFPCIFFLIILSAFQIKIHYLNLSVLLFWFFLAIFSSFYNQTFKPMIFYPVVGVFFVFVITQVHWIKNFHRVLFLYILISFCFGIMAYFIGPNIAVTSLQEKGIAFLLP